MHIALLNQHHNNPDCPATCRHYGFLAGLAERHCISLVTSDAWRRTRITHHFDWVPEGVRLYECQVAYENNMGVVRRLFSFAGFAAGAFYRAMRLPKPDVIWAVSTPLSTPWIAALVARLRGVPWVFEVQDLWPSFPIEMGAVRGKWLQRLLYGVEKRLYLQASHIIALSPDMTAYIEGLGISSDKISTNYNGTDIVLAEAASAAEVETLRKAYGLTDKQVVLYAGTYGRANDIPNLMQVVKLLANRQDITFVFAGHGFYEPALQQLAQHVPNLLLLPPQPRTTIFKWFRLASLSLVTFNNLPVLAANSPAKFYDSLACGTPVVVTNPGWTKDFVEARDCGWYVPAGQPIALSQLLKKLLAEPQVLKAAGKRGQAVAHALFDRRQLVRQVEAALFKVVGRNRKRD